MPNLKYGGLMLKLVFSMGVLALVIYFVDLREAARVALGVNPWYLIAFVVLAQLDRALMAYKWLPLLRVHKIKVPLLSATQMYSMSSLAGILLPSTVGGDVFRLYAVSRFKANTRHVLASIIVERALGLIALLILASISLGLASYLLKDRLPYAQGIWLALGVGGVFVLGLMGTLHPSVRLRLNRLVGRLTLFSFAAKLYRVYELSYEYRNHLPTVGRVFGLTFLKQLVPVATNFLLFRALGIEVSTLELLAIIPLIILAIRLPISFDGIGVQEGLYVGLFALVGVAPSEAILVSLITRDTLNKSGHSSIENSTVFGEIIDGPANICGLGIREQEAQDPPGDIPGAHGCSDPVGTDGRAHPSVLSQGGPRPSTI